MTDDILDAYNDSLKRSYQKLEKLRELFSSYYKESRSELFRAAKILGSMREQQRMDNEKTQVLQYNPYNDPRD